MKLNYRTYLMAALAMCLLAAAPAWAERPTPPVQSSDRMIASMLINGMRQAKLPADMPLYVTLTLDNPLDTELDMSALNWLKPVITDNEGKTAEMSWRAVGPKQAMLGAGKSLGIAWLPQETLAQGKYRIALEQPKDLGGGALAGVRIFPARLEITADKPDPAQTAMYQRRVWVLQGETEKAEAQVQQLIKDDPQNLELRLELADAYAAKGDYKQARQNIYLMLEQVQKDNPDKPLHPPAWVIGYLEQLKRMELRGAKSKAE